MISQGRPDLSGRDCDNGRAYACGGGGGMEVAGTLGPRMGHLRIAAVLGHSQLHDEEATDLSAQVSANDSGRSSAHL